MDIDEAKIDEAVLALLYLGRHDGDRTWKSFDWDALRRLHEAGHITNPISKAKSVLFTETGAEGVARPRASVATAVRKIIGIRLVFSRSRMRRASSYPSIPGIITSRRINAKS